MNIVIKYKTYRWWLFFLLFTTACSDLLEVPSPTNQLDANAVFTDSASANAAIAGVYSFLHNYNMIRASAFRDVVSDIGGKLSDEYRPFVNAQVDQFYQNSLLQQNSIVSNIWADVYKSIYFANNILNRDLEGSSISNQFGTNIKGEALFLRSFCLFYLSNYFGDIPLILSTDVETNKLLGRTPRSEVLIQIANDLILAKEQLQWEYSYNSMDRSRATSWAASALLARVYLYMHEYEKAEAEATVVLNETGLFRMEEPQDAFLDASREVIWRFASNDGNTYIQSVFSPNNLTRTPRVVLHEDFLSTFETSDLRRQHWVGSIVASDNNTYFYPSKYKRTGDNMSSPPEADVVLRLGEIWLVRAEARARQGSNKLSGAIQDLTEVRTRAGLETSLPAEQTTVLQAIEKERRVELFAEYSHRWFDLIRTDRVDAVMLLAKPNSWEPYAKWLPIPQDARGTNPALSQNLGYPQ